MAHVSRKPGPLTGRSEAISRRADPDKGCEVCLGPVGRRKKICSPRCRLVKWGAKALLEAWREGRADGLAEIIEEIKSEVKNV